MCVKLYKWRIMTYTKLAKIITCSFVCFAYFSLPAFAQGARQELLRLAQEANVAFNAGQFARALVLNRATLQLAEKDAATDPASLATLRENLAWNLVLLAEEEEKRFQLAAAVPLYEEAISLQEKARDTNIDSVLGKFAKLQDSLGDHAQAITLNQRALTLREAKSGLDHPSLVPLLASLGHIYRDLRQFARAQPLFKRALAINTRAYGPQDPRLAHLIGGLAQLHLEQGNFEQAETLYLQALGFHEKAGSPSSEDFASLITNLASVYTHQRKYAQAESFFARALRMWEALLGPDHPQVAATLNNLALLKFNQKQYAQAESMFLRALATRERVFGPSHPLVAGALANIAGLHEARGDMTQALAFMRKSSQIHRRRLIDGNGSTASSQEAQTKAGQFSAHLSMLARNDGKEHTAALADESFQLAQLTQASGTTAAVARMASRFASGNDAIAAIIKRKQDAIERSAKAEDSMLVAASQPAAQRNALAEQALRASVEQMRLVINTTDAELTARFPQYQELTRPEPISVGQVQALLQADEAMVAYSLDNSRSWMWVLRKSSVAFIPLQSSPDYFSRIVQQVRAQMDFDTAGKPKDADLNALRSLYMAAFAPAQVHLKDVNHVMLVPSGALQSLPFGMLVASALPGGNRTSYDKVDWLARHHAMSVLPSASAIRALRQFARPVTATKPYIGFGDPLLTDARPGTRALTGTVNASGLFRAAGAGQVKANTGQPDIADVAYIKGQVRLPETADEIRAMAKIMRSGDDSIWLQGKATETNVKRLDLSGYRILAFATHGVMAGELSAGMEPGLLLTPPGKGSTQDDGYLSAGEIAQLKLNADLVLLSACNTAAPDGQPGAEGLSGLAKAFFHAGTRSLLVSHWPVASEATVPLTTTMLKEYEAAPNAGKAQAHRKAMLALMNTPGHPEYAHPLFWAPFVVVGEGGVAAPF